MRIEKAHGMTSHPSGTIHTIESFNSNSILKYGGLVQETWWEAKRRDLMALFSYLYSLSLHYREVHVIVGILRVVQIVCFGLQSGNIGIWPMGSIERKVINVIVSVALFHTPSYRMDGGLYFLIGFCLIKSIFLVYLFKSARDLKKYGLLSNKSTIILRLYTSSVGFLLHPIACMIASSSLANMIFRDSYSILNLFVALSTYSLTIIYSSLYISIISQSLVFYPSSFMSTLPKPQHTMIVLTIILSISSGISDLNMKHVQMCCIIVSILIYFLMLRTPFKYGGYVKKFSSDNIIAASVFGIISSLMLCSLLIINKSSKLEYIFGLIVLYYVLKRLSGTLFIQRSMSILEKLDLIQENSEKYHDYASTFNDFLNMAIIGFTNNHPICLNWAIFKVGMNDWSSKPDFWFVFAKFLAVYPEENQQLIWAFQNASIVKNHSAAYRCIKSEAISIFQQRETNLSISLKQKLSSLSSKLSSARLKLRRAWDMVIQGNIYEIENCCLRAYEAIDRIDSDFQHLIQQYPNNSFVTRSYSRFLLELKADQVGSKIYSEKTKGFKRGVMFASDHCHEHGLLAFPLLPAYSSAKNNKVAFTYEAPVGGILECDSEEDINVNYETLSTLNKCIDDLSIPATKYSIYTRLILFFLFFLVVCMGMFWHLPRLYNSFLEPLPYIYHLANIRSCAFQMATFSMRYIYQELGFFSRSRLNRTIPPKSLGSTWDLVEQTIHIISNTITGLQSVSGFRTFEGDPIVELAKEIVFGKTINYRYHRSPEEIVEFKTDLQHALFDSILQLSTLLFSNTSIDVSILNTSIILNPLLNVGYITEFCNSALDGMIKSLHDTAYNTKRICNILLYIVMFLIITSNMVSYHIQKKMILSYQNDVAQSIVSLPKNVISQIVESLMSVKHDESGSSSVHDSDISRQEENILKIFNSGNDGTANSSGLIQLFAGSLLLIFSGIFISHIMIQLTISESILVENSAPHLNYITGSYAMSLGALLAINALAVMRTPARFVLLTEPIIINRYESRMELAQKYYHLARFGGNGDKETPFNGFSKGLIESAKDIVCKDPMRMPSNLFEISECFSADLVLTQMKPGFDSKLYALLDYDIDMDPGDQVMTTTFDLLIAPVYDNFLYPMFEEIIPTIQKDVQELFMKDNTQIIIVSLFMLMVEIFMLMKVYEMGENTRHVLKLLLHCPTKVVFENNKITRLLSGEFAESYFDNTKHNSEFFDNIYYNLPDYIISSGLDGKIHAVNYVTLKLIGKSKPEEIIGSDLSTIFNRNMFNGNFRPILENNPTSNDIFADLIKDDGTEINMCISVVIQHQIKIVTMRDITQTVRYNRLIREERSKSDSMLAAILPASLVSRVQKGEKDISFSVQSATVVFIDIVGFTPWCSSNHATIVMQTLNLLFKKYDFLIAQKSQMTKIKCIGDCYMAAGGIFSEINQPALHAKDAVAFGLEAIDAVEELNAETGQKLQIRVGINTGGPIVAGVLGVGKPTFEILGPTIAMAQQMEHHGIPMKVHISRSVYELVYGGPFKIKERGNVEIKNGTVVTYIVSKN